MEEELRLFEWKGYAVGILSFFVTLIFFYSYTAEFFYCFLAAIISAFFFWGSYLVIRMVILAIRK